MTADFNDDGRLDLAVANPSTDSVNVLLGNGNGTFQASKSSVFGDNPISIAVGDFNGVGELDLTVANSRTTSYTPQSMRFTGSPWVVTNCTSSP